MIFDSDFERFSRLEKSHLMMLAYLAFTGEAIYMYGSDSKTITKQLKIKDRLLYEIATALYSQHFVHTSFYSMEIASRFRVSVLAYVFSHQRSIADTIKSIVGARSDAYRFYELVGHIFCGGPMPKGKIELTEEDKQYIEPLPMADPRVSKLASYIDGDILSMLAATVDDYHITGRILAHGVFDMWRADMPKLKDDIDALEAYHSYVQDGVYKPVDLGDGKPKHVFAVVLAAVHACNMGNYATGLELFKIASKDIEGDITGVPPLFFALYYAAAACLHLSDSKSHTLAKRLASNKTQLHCVYRLASVLASIAIDPRRQADAYSLRDLLSATHDGVLAKNVIYLAQMIGRHFEVRDVPFVTGEPAYAIVRHEVAPIERQPAVLTSVYGTEQAVLSVPYLHAWERLLDSLSETLTSPQASASQSAARQSRCIYVVDDSTGDMVAMEQPWLKAQRWGKAREISATKYSLSRVENPDKYDEAFASACSAAYRWPKAASVLPLLKGCDRLFVRNGPYASVRSLEIAEEAPYVSVEKKGKDYVVTSNVSASDLTERSVLKKSKDGKYTFISIDDKARSVLRPLLSEISAFPIEAEGKLRSVLSLLDEVVEVRSKLLDRKLLPSYKGRPMIVVKLQPASGGAYEAAFRAQPLPDSTKTPPPGEGRPEIIDVIAGAQVRVARDLDGEKAAYKQVCDALDNVNGVELDDDDYRATLSIEAVLDLMAWAKANPDVVVIDWLQGREMTLKQAAGSSWNVGLKANNGWFDIEGEVRIDDDTVITMARLLEMVQQDRGRYLRLDDGLFIAIDKKLRRQLERIEALSVKNRNKLQISQINAAMLDDDALNGEFKLAFDQKLAKLMQNVKDSAAYNPRVPAALKAELRPYQVEGFQWMARLASWGAGACLADDMGLGKTVQTIAFLLLKASEGPALVLAPASVVPNWAAELERFAPSLRVSILNKADDRTATIRDAKEYDVILSTYGLLNTEEETLVEKKWSTICLDEAHTIKNRETKMSYVAMRLSADYRIILTGTPIQNHLGEIWNLFRFINPGLLGGFDTFRQKFVKPITEDNDKARRKALQSILRPFMLRRTKAEVIDDLPEKNEITIPVELSDAELTRYEAMRKKAAQEISTADKVDINTLAEITRLRRAACSMALVDSSWTGQDSKVQAFLDIVSEFKGNGKNRMLVFSQFTSYLDIVRKALDSAGEKYLYLDGSTTMKQREQLVAQFRNGDVPLFLISLKAGGLGLNLPEANYVMHLDPWWNPAIEQQATDRAYRIGQKRDVTVYHLVSKNTIEEKILRLHRTKRDLADSLLEGTDMAGKLTVKDILELLSNA